MKPTKLKLSPEITNRIPIVLSEEIASTLNEGRENDAAALYLCGPAYLLGVALAAQIVEDNAKHQDD